MTTSILLTGPQVLNLERILEIIYAILFSSYYVSDRKELYGQKKNQTLPPIYFPGCVLYVYAFVSTQVQTQMHTKCGPGQKNSL